MKIHHLFFPFASAVLAILLSSSVYAESVSWGHNDQVWLTRDSEHFSIHFLEGHRQQADRALDIAERVHSDLTAFFPQLPDNKTEVVLVDEKDYSNGWATPLPFAQIRLYMSPPEDVTSLESNDEWMHMLIRHEYAHIVHMELAGGAVKAVRSVLGRNPFLFPHALTPSFLLEGLAVYLETNKQLGYGRLQGSFYDMQMRTEVASGQLKSLSEVAVANREWPRGYQYLYGAYFIEYLADTYGEEKLTGFLNNYSRQLIPYFFLHSTAKTTFGKDFDQLWTDYRAYLINRFDDDIATLGQESVSGELVATSPYLQAATATQNGLLVNQRDGENRPVLSALGVVDGEHVWTSQIETKGITAIDDHPEAGLIASRLVRYVDGRDMNDLFLLENGSWRQLTEGQRFRKVRWMPDGKSVIASRKQDGLSEVWQIDLAAFGRNKASSNQDKEGNQAQTANQRFLWQGESGVVLGGFSVSPKGDALVAATKRPRQGWNLEQFTFSDSSWRPLTHSKATENSPEYLPDGKVMFSADYDGVYNVYVMDLGSKAISRWTAETGGAFVPVWQPELGVAYQAYGSEGYELRIIEAPQTLDQFSADSQQGQYDYPPAVIEAAEKSEPRDYSPWSTLRPRTWIPLLIAEDQQTQIGVSIFGSDALGRHAYQLAGTWDTKNELAAYSLIYQYDNRWLINARRSHEFETINQNGKTGYRISRDDSALVQRDHIFNAFEDQLSVHAGVYLDKSSEVSTPSFSNMVPFRNTNETLTGLAVTFDNREGYLNVPGIGWGHYLDIVAETNEVLDSDFKGEKYQAQWQDTWDLPGRTTITAQLAAGYADDGAKAFRLGGNDSSDSLGLFGRDTQMLRGYDDNVQRGHRYAVQRLSVQSWLARVEDNWSLYPVGLGDISGSVFVDSGATWDSGASAKQLTGVGAELTVEAILGYSFVLPVTVGYGHGLDDTLGKNKVYLNIRSEF